jgi:hypothetical protein
MTETEWLACKDPGWLILHLICERLRRVRQRRGRARKLRLAVCACCRRVWRHLPDARCREAVAVAERYADGLAGEEERRAALGAAEEALGATGRQAARAARCAWRCLAADTDALAACTEGMESAAWATAGPDEEAHFNTSTDPAGFPGYAAERHAQVPLLRCVFGNPFRPVGVEPAWVTWNGGAVVRLAQAAYDQRDPEGAALDAGRLGILADALEEAACADGEILGHLRGPGPHVRGCHIVDRVRSVD